MDDKTRRTLIIVCVVAFLLTSTFTWGLISAFIDVGQKGAEIAVDSTQVVAEKARSLSAWTRASSLSAHFLFGRPPAVAPRGSLTCRIALGGRKLVLRDAEA